MSGKSYEDMNFVVTKPDKGDEWLTSYSDLVTVLLCFFIMFFVIKAKQQEKEIRESLNKKKADEVLTSLGKSMESSSPERKFDLRKLHQYIQVVIKHEKLFEGEDLSIDAKYQLAKLAEASFKYMPKVMLQISSVSDSRSPASEESSLKRSLKVRNYLEGLGLEKELMTIGSLHKKNTEDNPQEEIKIVITRNVIVQE